MTYDTVKNMNDMMAVYSYEENYYTEGKAKTIAGLSRVDSLQERFCVSTDTFRPQLKFAAGTSIMRDKENTGSDLTITISLSTSFQYVNNVIR